MYTLVQYKGAQLCRVSQGMRDFSHHPEERVHKGEFDRHSSARVLGREKNWSYGDRSGLSGTIRDTWAALGRVGVRRSIS